MWDRLFSGYCFLNLWTFDENFNPLGLFCIWILNEILIDIKNYKIINRLIVLNFNFDWNKTLFDLKCKWLTGALLATTFLQISQLNGFMTGPNEKIAGPTRAVRLSSLRIRISDANIVLNNCFHLIYYLNCFSFPTVSQLLSNYKIKVKTKGPLLNWRSKVNRLKQYLKVLIKEWLLWRTLDISLIITLSLTLIYWMNGSFEFFNYIKTFEKRENALLSNQRMCF